MAQRCFDTGVCLTDEEKRSKEELCEALNPVLSSNQSWSNTGYYLTHILCVSYEEKYIILKRCILTDSPSG